MTISEYRARLQERYDRPRSLPDKRILRIVEGPGDKDGYEAEYLDWYYNRPGKKPLVPSKTQAAAVEKDIARRHAFAKQLAEGKWRYKRWSSVTQEITRAEHEAMTKRQVSATADAKRNRSHSPPTRSS